MLKNLSLKNFKVSSILVAALLATAALPSAAAADPAASASQMATKWVHMKGIVAEVGVPLRKLVGVKVGVVENSKWRTTVKADGTYDLKVPAQTTVTRYFDLGRDTADPADDHLRIYSPTIKTTKTGVPRWSSLNVALPSLTLARELANLVKIDIADGKDAPQDCVVVSLTAIKAFEKMTFAQVVARNNLVGVPGAKPTISPCQGDQPALHWRKPDACSSPNDDGHVWPRNLHRRHAGHIQVVGHQSRQQVLDDDGGLQARPRDFRRGRPALTRLSVKRSSAPTRS